MKILMLAGILSALGAGLVAASMSAGAAAGGVEVASGGIGVEERTELIAARSAYNLRVTFANKGSGAYRADVDVEIRDVRAAGKPVVLEVRDAGPLLYANLPPGRYEVSVQSQADRQAHKEAHRQARTLALPAGSARELYFYWDEQ